MSDSGSSPAAARLSTFAYRFPLPAAKLIKFVECFEGALGHADTAAVVASMDRARRDLVHELASGEPNYENAAAAAKRYVPLIGQVRHRSDPCEMCDEGRTNQVPY